jgi:hypothetical protein
VVEIVGSGVRSSAPLDLLPTVMPAGGALAGSSFPPDRAWKPD